MKETFKENMKEILKDENYDSGDDFQFKRVNYGNVKYLTLLVYDHLLSIWPPTKTKAQQKKHDIQEKVGKSLNNPEVKDLVGVRTKKQTKEILE